MKSWVKIRPWRQQAEWGKARFDQMEGVGGYTKKFWLLQQHYLIILKQALGGTFYVGLARKIFWKPQYVPADVRSKRYLWQYFFKCGSTLALTPHWFACYQYFPKQDVVVMWYSQSLKPSVQLHVNIPQRLQAWPVLNVSVKQIQNIELEDIHQQIHISL